MSLSQRNPATIPCQISRISAMSGADSLSPESIASTFATPDGPWRRYLAALEGYSEEVDSLLKYYSEIREDGTILEPIGDWTFQCPDDSLVRIVDIDKNSNITTWRDLTCRDFHDPQTGASKVAHLIGGLRTCVDKVHTRVILLRNECRWTERDLHHGHR